MPTKAETLIKLEKYQKKINIIIPKFFYFKKKDYFQSKLKILKKIEKIFKGKNYLKIIFKTGRSAKYKQCRKI